MKRARLLPAALLAILALALLAACTTGGEVATPAAPLPTAAVTRQASPASGAASAPTLGPRVKLKVSYPDGGGHSVVQYAFEKGIYSKYNLDVELAGLGGGSPAMAALVSGETQIADITGSTVVGAVAGGADVVMVAVLIPTYPYVFMVPASIRTTNDLKGKQIAVRAFGDATDVAVRVALRKLGMDPEKDVQIVAVNDEGARMAALLAGQICCTVAQPQDEATLQARGFHELFDLAALELPNSQGAIAVNRSYLNANREVVQRFIDALIESIATIRKDKPGGVAVLKKYLKLDDDAVAGVLYDYFIGKVVPPLPYAKPEQFKDAIEILGTQNPNVKGLDINKYLDSSFVKSAEDRGVHKR